MTTPQDIKVDSVSLLPASSAAWYAAATKQAYVVIHNATIQNPSIATSLPSHLQHLHSSISNNLPLDLTASTPPAEGFILTGSIHLFGIDNLEADFYSYHGPLPPHTTLPPQTPSPENKELIYQIATLKGDLSVSKLLPEFSNTPFDSISLRNLTLTYQVAHHLLLLLSLSLTKI
jgi:hypothetical protein